MIKYNQMVTKPNKTKKGHRSKFLKKNKPTIVLVLSGVMIAFIVFILFLISVQANIEAAGTSLGPVASKTDYVVPNQFTFYDNFNNGDKSGWQKVDSGQYSAPSNWDAKSGEMVQSTNVSDGILNKNSIPKEGTYAFAGNANWKDYEYSVKVKSSDNDAIGVMFRYIDNNNYYRFSMDKERNYRRLVKKVNGQFTTIAEQNTGYNKDQWYTLKVRAIGQNIKVYLDNSSVFDVNDTSLANGKIALYSWGNQNSYFDNVKVNTSVDSFTIAVLPDTQYYSKNYPQIYTSQTEWLAQNRASQNIAFVLHEGDIVDGNSVPEWENARTSMNYLDGKLPYFMAPGNHDSKVNSLNQTGRYNKYFPVSKFSTSPYFGGVYQPGKIDNNYNLISVGGIDWLEMGLEYGPQDAVLSWANSITHNYPNRNAIVLTHAYLYPDGTLSGSNPNQSALTVLPGANNGTGIWDKYAKLQQNIKFVLSGHFFFGDGVAKTVSNGENGNKVYQMLADYQHVANGGNGYMRLLKFYPAQDKIEVKTYSPYLNQYKTDPENQFEYTNIDLKK